MSLWVLVLFVWNVFLPMNTVWAEGGASVPSPLPSAALPGSPSKRVGKTARKDWMGSRALDRGEIQFSDAPKSKYRKDGRALDVDVD